MPKIFIIVPHNNPSGGTKVANQTVNLFIEKGYESFLVIAEDNPKSASFLKCPAPAISADDFQKKCGENDIAITFWQSKVIYELFKKCPAKNKIFWQHGIIIPKYTDFNGEIFFQPGIFTDFWNVSQACADYIKNKYKTPEIKIVHPFFDDETLLEYSQKKNEAEREGILILRRRGQEAIPDIISLFPEQKITILPKTFSDSDLYSQLIKHKYFISTDNGVDGNILIKNKWRKTIKKLSKILKNIFKKPGAGQIGWIKPDKNLLGFPVTACEAAWLQTAVIAFAMGGGLEWMTNKNIFLAKDGDMHSLLEKIKEAISTEENILKIKKEKAFFDVQKFSKENTWKQLKKNLNL